MKNKIIKTIFYILSLICVAAISASALTISQILFLEATRHSTTAADFMQAYEINNAVQFFTPIVALFIVFNIDDAKSSKSYLIKQNNLYQGKDGFLWENPNDAKPFLTKRGALKRIKHNKNEYNVNGELYIL